MTPGRYEKRMALSEFKGSGLSSTTLMQWFLNSPSGKEGMGQELPPRGPSQGAWSDSQPPEEAGACHL